MWTRKIQNLLFAYAFDDEEVKIIDLERGEKLPDRVLKALLDKNVVSPLSTLN